MHHQDFRWEVVAETEDGDTFTNRYRTREEAEGCVAALLYREGEAYPPAGTSFIMPDDVTVVKAEIRPIHYPN